MHIPNRNPQLNADGNPYSMHAEIFSRRLEEWVLYGKDPGTRIVLTIAKVLKATKDTASGKIDFAWVKVE